MTRVVLGTLLSYWWRQPLQFATLVVGLAMAVALWTGVQAINTEARASYSAAETTLRSTARASLVASGRRIAAAEFVALRRAGWQVDPLIEGQLVLGDAGYTLRGVDLISFGAEPSAQITGPALRRGAIFSNPADLADLRAQLGDALLSHDQVPRGHLMADIPTAAALLHREIAFDRLLLRTSQPQNQGALSEVAPGLRRVAPQTGDQSRLTDSFHLNLSAFGLLSFAVGLFIVHGAVGLAFEQRRQTLRNLRAMGVPARVLVGVLFGELSLIALISGAIGVVLGYGIAAVLLPDISATLRGIYGADVDATLSIRPSWWVSGFVMALAGAWIASAAALWQVLHMPLLASARPRAWSLASAARLRVQALGGMALLALAIALGSLGTGLIAGFAMLAALLLGAALILPIGLAMAVSFFGQMARGAIAQWFWADTRQQLPGLSLALMALLLALAANIGVGTMVSSFRLTFVGWLDQRLAADLYVTAQDEAQAKTLRQWLSARADVTAVLPIWNTETELGGETLQLYTVTDHAIYRDNWPMLSQLPNAWSRIGADTAVLINEQMARKGAITLGDALDLGAAGVVEVAGIYSDYGNPTPQVLMHPDRLLRAFPEVARLRHGLALSGDPTAMGAAMQRELGVGASAILRPEDIKTLSLSVFERTFAVTGALNTLTLAVAAIAILTSLLTLAGMRLPQLAPIWALGQTRQQLARLEVLRAVALAGLTFVLALPLGLTLAWALLAIVNVEAFGWKLPMFVFPAQWAGLLAMALFAAMIAAVIPALRLSRLEPTQLLGAFANER